MSRPPLGATGMSAGAAVCRVAVIVLSAACAAGCVTGRYPADWPERLAAGNGCVDLSGIYSNAGRISRDWAGCDGSVGQDTYCRLHSTLFIATPFGGETIGDLHMTQQVEVDYIQPASYKISAFGPAGSLLSSSVLTEADGHFRCTQEGVEFSSGWKGYGGDTMGATGMGKGVFTFTKGADGSLIVRRKTVHAGAIVIVPFAGSRSDWSMWPAAAGAGREPAGPR